MTAPRYSTDIDFGGRRVEHPPQNPSKAWQKANSVFCPLGPSPTTAWIVMQRGELSQLDVTQAYTLTWNCNTVTTDDASGPSTTTLTYQGLYIRHAERLFPGGDGDSSSLYLVELVDGRFKAAEVSNSGSLVSNLRTYANSNTYLLGSDTTNTWDQLLEALWAASSYLGTYPGIPGTLPIDGLPSNHWAVGKNAYYQLCELLNFLDLAIQPNPSAGTFGLVQLGSSQVISSNSSSKQFDGDHIGNELGKAASLEIFRMVYRKGYGQERDTEYTDNWAYDGFYQSSTVATNIPTGNGTAALWDDLPLILDEYETVTNQASVDTRNTNIASRYATRKSVTSRHRIHYGLFATDYLPGGQIKAVLWRNWGYQDAKQNRLGGTVTEFIASINLIGGYEAGESIASPTHFKDLTVFNEAYAPPDLERRSCPNYPRLPNIIQVWHTTGGPSPGDSLTPDGTASDGSKLHSGRVKRWVANEMVTLDPCWILFVDEYDSKKGNIVAQQGEYFGPGRLSGMTTDSATTLPIYLVKSGTTTNKQIIYFRLNEELFLQGQALATVQQLVAGNWIDTVPPQVVTVIDEAVSVGCWAAYTGDKGHAILRDDGLYGIIFMERPSLMLESFTKTDRDPAGIEIPSTFTSRYQQGGKLTPDEAASTGEDVTIFDSKTFYPRAVKSGNSLAIWNDVRKRREAVIVQQQGLWATAKLQNALHGSGTYAADVPFTDFVLQTFSPFNLTPTAGLGAVDALGKGNAANLFHLHGEPGDNILLLWIDKESSWLIIEVEQAERNYEFVTLSTDNGSGNLQKGAIAKDTFLGNTVDPYAATVPGQASLVTITTSRPCIIQFADFSLNSPPNWPILVELNRIYGPAKWVGWMNSAGPFDPAKYMPMYRCCIGEQGFHGKEVSDIAKGDTGTFQIYDWSNPPSAVTGVTIDAVCLYNAYTADQFARISVRDNIIIANQIEC